MEKQGLVHIYEGDGKGKTTAAVGLAVRCAGAGGRVLFFQFLKDGSSSEIPILKTIPNIEVADPIPTTKFVFQMSEEEKMEMADLCHKKLGELQVLAASGKVDMMILDEVIHIVNFGFVSVDEMLSFIKNKPRSMELVLTGRDPKRELIDAADYVSEVRKIKHPYDRGIPARRMIEL